MKKLLLILALFGLIAGTSSCKNSKKAQKTPTQKVQGKVITRDQWNNKH